MNVPVKITPLRVLKPSKVAVYVALATPGMSPPPVLAFYKVGKFGNDIRMKEFSL
jgi:hypothetical protein